MPDHSSVLDLSKLRRMEAECQALLLTDPTDGNARIQIAWCLFLQAIQLSAKDGEPATVRTFLHDCVLHTALLSQLNSPETSYEEVKRLRALIQALGGNEIVRDVDNEVSHLFSHLCQDILRAEGRG